MTYVHEHYRSVTVTENSTGNEFILEPAYNAVILELTARGDVNKNVKFQKDLRTGSNKVRALVVVH